MSSALHRVTVSLPRDLRDRLKRLAVTEQSDIASLILRAVTAEVRLAEERATPSHLPPSPPTPAPHVTPSRKKTSPR